MPTGPCRPLLQDRSRSVVRRGLLQGETIDADLAAVLRAQTRAEPGIPGVIARGIEGVDEKFIALEARASPGRALA